MRGQVWVETVIYTLIGLSLIGIVLSLVTPKIQEYQDRALIEQTINSLNIVDSKMSEVLRAPLNTRVVQFNLKRGNLVFDSEQNTIQFVLDGSHALYSEEGRPIMLGRMEVLTEKQDRLNRITITLNYEVNITLSGEEFQRTFTPTSVPYRFSFENLGVDSNGQEIIMVRELSSG